MKYEVDVEQTLRDSSSTTSQEQSLVVTTGNEEPRKRHHRVASSSDVSDEPNPKAVCSHQRHQHIDTMIKKVKKVNLMGNE